MFVPFTWNYAERSMVRELWSRHANEHEACASVDLPERSKPHRCATCGLKLLFGDNCPFHPSSERVRWTEELGAAYREAVEAFAQGERLAVPAGRGDELVLARRLRDKWGNVA